MSRWNKNNNRFPQTVVPLDNLLREKENKSVAIGTVGRFGDCKFTSIRSSCYSKCLRFHTMFYYYHDGIFLDMGALSSTSPIQNSADSPTGQNELTDKITVEQVPKPRKFFKSRNAAPPAEIQQQMVMQQQASYHQQQSYQNHQPVQHDHNQYPSGADDDEQTPKRGKKRRQTVKKEKVEKPPKPPKPQKVLKPKKEKKIKVKEIEEPVEESAPSENESPSPTRRGRAQIEPTRSSGRSRARCVNYNEDAGEDEFYTRIERRIVPKQLATATVTSLPEPLQQASLEVPMSQQSPVLHPPIVLRISKVSFNICFVIT